MLASLGPCDVRTLRLFPVDGAPLAQQLDAGSGDIVQRLLDLDVIDPTGMVSFRVQLVEPCAGGLRLSRLGRAVVAEADGG